MVYYMIKRLQMLKRPTCLHSDFAVLYWYIGAAVLFRATGLHLAAFIFVRISWMAVHIRYEYEVGLLVLL